LVLDSRYQALKPIGQGGFGRTFLAVDRSTILKPRCVIKQLYPQQMGVEGKASELFRQEAEQLLRLGHYPSIPTFLDYFEQDGYQYLIQEFIEGQNLAEISATGRLFTEAEILGLLETLLETLDFLHYRNIIHRDVKPANIIETTNGRFVLVDLGAAKLMTGTALGQTGTVIGSAEYVAPEQLRGKAIFASDLYSLGATCITLLTGMSPFTLFDTSTGRWEWRDYLAQPVGDRLGDLLDGLLEGPTKLRYGSADSVLRDLNVVSGRQVEAQSIDSWQREEADRLDDGPVDSWHQVEEVRSSELDASFAKPGEVAEVRKRSDRKTDKKLLNSPQVASLIIVATMVWLPVLSLLFTFRVQRMPLKGMSTVPISKIIEPAYSNPIKPFKTFKNIQPFQAMALQDGGKTIVTGASDKGEIRLDFISSSTGETSSILKLNNSVLKNATKPPLHKLYINRNNVFVYFNVPTGLNLLKINTKDKSKSLPFGPSSNSIFPVSNGESFNRVNRNGSGSIDIWEITDNGDIKNRKSLNGVAFAIFSSDQKRVLRWSHSSLYQVSIFNINGQTTENPMSLPSGTLPSSDSYRYVNLFSSRKDSEEYLVTQPEMMGYSSKDFSKISGTLPSFYQSKALQTSGRGQTPHQGSIYVWDMKQQQFKYFIPSQGKIQQISIAPDGKTLAVTETGGDRPDPNKKYSQSRLTVWDLPTGQLLRDVDIDRTSVSLAFTADSKTLVTGAQNTRSYIGETPPPAANAEISLWNVDQLRNP